MKYPWEYFYQIILRETDLKNSLLLIFELLRLFAKTLTADGTYSLCNIWNLQELYQMQLSKKLRTFCLFFRSSLKSASNFQDFEKKMTLIAYIFSKLQTVKDMVRRMFRNSRFRAPIDTRHVKTAQKLMTSAWQLFYYIV